LLAALVWVLYRFPRFLFAVLSSAAIAPYRPAHGGGRTHRRLPGVLRLAVARTLLLRRGRTALRVPDSVAIVTGSSSETGIGAECAKIIASHGGNVIVNYASNKDGAERTAALCRQSGAEALVVQGDVAKDDDCRRLVDSALKHWGRLDVLVNNAAVTKPIPHRELDKLDAEEFQRIYSVNSIGNFQMTH
jgi:hypothetical protein